MHVKLIITINQAESESILKGILPNHPSSDTRYPKAFPESTFTAMIVVNKALIKTTDAAKTDLYLDERKGINAIPKSVISNVK